MDADYTILPVRNSQAVASLIMCRRTHPANLCCVASTTLPTQWGIFQALGFERMVCNGIRRVETAVALALGELQGDAPPVRIHSQCLTGDVLGSLRCDCGDQLEFAMRAIAREQRGLLIYEQQEGRGIGLMAKLQAYALQDKGLDTIEANEALGLSIDYRDYSLPVAILQYLGIERVRLLTNNPDKCRALECAGIDVVEKIACEATPNPNSIAYLRAKRERMGHTLQLCISEESAYARNGPAGSLGAGAKESSRNELFAPGFTSIEDAFRNFRQDT